MFLKRRNGARRLDLRFVVVVDFVIFVEEDWGKKVGFRYLCFVNDFDDFVAYFV